MRTSSSDVNSKQKILLVSINYVLLLNLKVYEQDIYICLYIYLYRVSTQASELNIYGQWFQEESRKLGSRDFSLDESF